MKKLFLFLVVSALCGTVFAGGNGHHDGGRPIHRGGPTEDNQAYIMQVGALNDALVDQTGAEHGKAYIAQYGFDNEASIVQSGRGNKAGGLMFASLSLQTPGMFFFAVQDGWGPGVYLNLRDIELMCGEVLVTPRVRLHLPWVGFGIVEIGAKNSAGIEQSGLFNAAGIRLEGFKLDAKIEQSGKRNVGLMSLKGSDVEAKQIQYGRRNFAYSYLEGTGGHSSDVKAYIVQGGMKNLAVQKASGKDLDLGIDQRFFTYDNKAVQLVEGEHNKAFIRQAGFKNRALEMIEGEGNIAAIAQYGLRNDAMIKQGGSQP